ncbi:hypothetical protein V1478_011049 [Vespula squamosa]|uniref:Uncharacterized protein n=1 Tax=Vespula squamosa TaxID=30214 RepID=A0ABD2AH47_VESSQ
MHHDLLAVYSGPFILRMRYEFKTLSGYYVRPNIIEVYPFEGGISFEMKSSANENRILSKFIPWVPVELNSRFTCTLVDKGKASEGSVRTSTFRHHFDLHARSGYEFDVLSEQN